MNYAYMEFRFDQGRVDRAKKLVAVSIDASLEPLPDNHYMVVGIAKESVHYCMTKPHLDCDCEDFAVGHDRLCKHLIASLLFEQEPIFMASMEGVMTPAKIRLVCGPPAAGKSTYITDRAKYDDLIWDFDKVSKAIGISRSTAAVTIVTKMRNAFLLELQEQVKSNTLGNNVWIGFSLPKSTTRNIIADRLNAEIVVLETSAADCRDNGIKRGGEEEGVRMFRDANRWWSRYDRCETDTIVM